MNLKEKIIEQGFKFLQETESHPDWTFSSFMKEDGKQKLSLDIHKYKQSKNLVIIGSVPHEVDYFFATHEPISDEEVVRLVDNYLESTFYVGKKK